MNIFIFTIIFITLCVCFAFYKYINKSSKNISVEEINTKLFRQQFDEIKSDFERGLIEENEYISMEKELSKRVLAYAPNNNNNSYNDKNSLNFTVLLIFIILILFTFFTYIYNGNPNLPDLSYKNRINIGVPNVFYEQALKDVNKNIIKEPQNIELYILKANTYTLLDKQDESLSLWKYIMDNFPEEASADIYLSYGEALMQDMIDKENKIIISETIYKIFEKASSKSEISTEVWAISSFYVGLYLYQQNNINEAKAIWSFILDKSPRDSIWRANLVRQIDQLLPEKTDIIDDEDIIEMVNRLEKRLYVEDSKDISDWQRLGKSFLVLGQIKKSIEAYNKAYLLDEDNMESLKGLAEAKLLSLNPDQKISKAVLELFNKIIIQEPNNPLALWVLAEEEIYLNNFNKAKILLNNLLLQLSPDSEEYKLVEDKLEKLNR